MSSSAPASASGIDSVESLDALLLAVEDCGRHLHEPRAYYHGLLSTLLTQGPFSAATIWSIDGHAWQLRATAPETAEPPAPGPEHHQRALSGQCIDLSSASPSGNGAAHPSRLLAGFRIGPDFGGALDVTLRTPQASERQRRLVEALAEMIGHAETRLRLDDARERVAALTSADRLIRQFHSGDTAVETALVIAAGLQQELEADRCWICRPHSVGAKVLATGATADVAGRQLLAKRVEAVATFVLSSGRELQWSVGEPTGAATEACRALADEGSARQIDAFPLSDGVHDRPIAAVVLETFSGSPKTGVQHRKTSLAPHAGLALSRALQSDARGWRSAWAGNGAHSWRKRALVIGLPLAALVFLALPVSNDIDAEGRLVPVTVQSVFAPQDGIVEQLSIQHGDNVRKGEELLQLRNPELDLERERLTGQISELEAKLASIQVLRTQGRRPAGETAGDLSAQEEQLQTALEGARRQLTLVQRQRETLVVRSPATGVVDRWDLEEALPARPVGRGQYLLDVMDTAGPWKLELEIPDKHIGEVLASRQAGAPLTVRYVLRTDPHVERVAQVSTIGERTELDPQGHLIVRATALLEKSSGSRRAGASVAARIECGRRSRGFVWFRDLWNFLALQLL